VWVGCGLDVGAVCVPVWVARGIVDLLVDAGSVACWPVLVLLSRVVWGCGRCVVGVSGLVFIGTLLGPEAARGVVSGCGV